MQFPDLEELKGSKELKMDVSKWVQKIKANWLIFVCCILGMLLIALIYLASANPVFNVTASFLVKSEGSNGEGQGNNSSGYSSLQSLGILSGGNNVANELQIIVSPTLIEEVVNKLQLYLDFDVRRGFRRVPLYKDSLPFTVVVDSFHTKNLAYNDLFEYKINIEKDGYVITSSADDDKFWHGKWGVPLAVPFGNILLNKNESTDKWNNASAINLRVSPVASVVDNLQNAIEAEQPGKSDNIDVIDLGLPSVAPEKGVDILNTLIDVYQKAGVEDNNRVADSTINFINDRLASVSMELSSWEGKIQDFKQKNNLADITAQSQALITNAGTAAQNLADQQVQLSVVNALLKYTEINKDSLQIIPASTALQNPAVSANIDQYNMLLLQRQRLLLSSTVDNPLVKNLDTQLEGLRSGMLSELQSVKHSLEVAINQMQNNSSAINDTLRRVPAKERVFLEYSRQQELEQQLYLFLLQQKEQTAISKSSTVSNIRVIDYARVSTLIVSPKKKLIVGIAILIGIILPFIYLFLIELINTKIRKREDIENNTKIPILAEILHGTNNDSNRGIVITATSRDPIAEQFRTLRTDLNFLLPKDDEKVIIITSSMPGEGKSFVSLNLSATMALSGKKTVVLEMDLRKPRLSQKLGIRPAKGYTHYAIGQAKLEEVIYPVEGYPNLSIIPCGPIPPNPAELILLEKTRDMFGTLKQQFDYIIIDTTPNIVTDAKLLAQYADVTLYLVRVGHTFKEQIPHIERLKEEGKFPRLNIVVNDISVKKSGYGHYGYGQGYGYGYGYFGEADKRSKLKWWKFWQN